MDKIDNIEHLRQLEDSLRGSIDRIRLHKENFGKNQLISLDCASQSHQAEIGNSGQVDNIGQESDALNELNANGCLSLQLGEQYSYPPYSSLNLVTYFVCSMREDRLLKVLDHQMLNERNVEQLKEVASLARRCIRDKGEERPTMKEVTMELEGLRAMEKHPWMGGDLYPEEDEYFLGKLSDHHGGNSSIGVAGYDSIRSQVPFEIEDGQ